MSINGTQKTNMFIKIAVAVFLAFCIISIIKLQVEFNELSREKDVLEQNIREYSDTIASLKEQLEEPYDEEYIKRVAREMLNYHMPEEIIFYNDLEK